MTIETYLQVREQLTDEVAWRKAMRALKRKLGRRGGRLAPRYLPDVLLHRTLARIPGLRGCAANAELIVSFLQRDFALLELSEPLNFGDQAGWFCDEWYWFKHSPAELPRLRAEMETLTAREAAGTLSFKDQHRLHRLRKEVPQLEAVPPGQREKLEAWFAAPCGERCSESTCRCGRRPSPPILYQLPGLYGGVPLFARHFKQIVGSSLHRCAASSRSMHALSVVLERFFPGKTQMRCSCDDDAVLHPRAGEVAPRREFYQLVQQGQRPGYPRTRWPKSSVKSSGEKRGSSAQDCPQRDTARETARETAMAGRVESASHHGRIRSGRSHQRGVIGTAASEHPKQGDGADRDHLPAGPIGTEIGAGA